MPRPSSDLDAFEESVAWFRERVALTDDEYARLSKAAKQQAFSVAGVSQLRLVNGIMRDLERAMKQGGDFAKFKRNARRKLEQAWGKGKVAPYRLEAIWRTETQKAYSAGRYAQLTKQSTINLRPFWMYDAVLDSRTSRKCSSRNGTIRAHDDPWWQSNWPPLHVNCRSGVRALRRSDAEARGGVKKRRPKEAASEGFGNPPKRQDLFGATDVDFSDIDPELAREFRRKTKQT